MSISDLHFYLVPKKEVVDKEPSIEFMSISLGTTLGSEMSEFVPRDGKKHILTTDIVYEITRQLEGILNTVEEEFDVLGSFLKNISIDNLETLDAYFEDYKDKSGEIRKLKEARTKFELIAQMVTELEYTDCAAIELMIC